MAHAGGPKGYIRVSPETAGRWQSSSDLADRLDVHPSSIRQCGAPGCDDLCRGWFIERREATAEDYERNLHHNSVYAYRAVHPSGDACYAACDVVCDRVIPEYCGGLEACRSFVEDEFHRDGPPMVIIQVDEPPELGVRLTEPIQRLEVVA